MKQGHRWLPGAILLLGPLAGCGSQDADGLARIAGKTAVRIESATAPARGKLADSWQAIRGSLGETTLDSRVATRLRWDKLLTGLNLQVTSPSQGVVEVKGTVADVPQRRRIHDLAESTHGVEKVLDSLAGPGGSASPEP